MESLKAAELVQKSLEGDKDAFVELAKSHQNMVFALARQHTRVVADAEDMAQEAFLRAYRDLRKLRKPGRFGQWLYGIVLNVSRERTRSRRPSVPLESIPEPADTRTDSTGERKGEQLLALVAELPEEYGVPLTMHYVNGCPYAEIAAALGMAEATARSRVHRARAMLREMMSDEEA